VKNHEVDVIVGRASDRYTRFRLEMEGLIDLLESTGWAVATVTSGRYDLTIPEGRATARIHGAIARQESERKSTRASEGVTGMPVGVTVVVRRGRATRLSRVCNARLRLRGSSRLPS
jgi:DNA invertase Pin-like site-specific DNA recombinase